MSHFSVLVVASNKEELEKRLLPFHEYECTGIEEYTEFVPEDMGELEIKFREHGKGESFEEFIPEWCGAKRNEAGVWGRKTNPRAKWDWWSIGGRWSNMLMLKDGSEKNYARLKDIDIEKMKQQAADRAQKRYLLWHGRPSPDDAVIYREYIFKHHLIFIDKDEIADLETLTSQKYIEKYGTLSALTYALLTEDGIWQARGDMGWFGLDSDHDYSYDSKFWEYLNSLDQGKTVFVVDAHI